MKKLYTTLLLFCFTLDMVTAQEKLSDINKSEILEIFNQQEQAWNRGDIPVFMEGYWKSEDLAFLGSSGPTFGWEATKERYLRSYPDTVAMGKLTFQVIKLQQIKEGVAQMIGSFHLKRTIGDLRGYFTLVWRKFNNEWVIISDHTSSAK